jgi:hypothetical protein
MAEMPAFDSSRASGFAQGGLVASVNELGVFVETRRGARPVKLKSLHPRFE